MSALSIAMYTVAFIVLAIQFTGSYGQFSMSEQSWTIVSVISVIGLIAASVWDFINRGKKDKNAGEGGE